MSALPSGRGWQPGSWRDSPARQQPQWPDLRRLSGVTAELANRPGLVDPGEVYRLRAAMAQAATGRALVLQAGDCAETFDPPSADDVAARVRMLDAGARLLSDAFGLPTVPVGRIAGQYAKPRSSSIERVNGAELPAFRGFNVNSPEHTVDGRTADPGRLLQAYEHSRQTYALLRELAGPAAPGYPRRTAVWTSHEALVLDYEEQFTRRDPRTGAWVLTTTHLPWIGVRTSDPGEAHIEFMSGLANPVGCKVGPQTTPDELAELCARLDPAREPGRLVLISRMGAEAVRAMLPPLAREVRRLGHPVVWMCDPMHGNTLTVGGRKTRRMDDVLAELRGFFEVMREVGCWPGGVHLEATSDHVTECIDCTEGRPPTDLQRRYTTVCDPRLNLDQLMIVLYHVAQLPIGSPA